MDPDPDLEPIPGAPHQNFLGCEQCWIFSNNFTQTFRALLMFASTFHSNSMKNFPQFLYKKKIETDPNPDDLNNKNPEAKIWRILVNLELCPNTCAQYVHTVPNQPKQQAAY
jgi:hypothetical protein